MNPETQIQQEAVALAGAGEHRGTPLSIPLFEALSANAGLSWVRDVARLEAAKSYFRACQYDQAARICDDLLTEEDEQTPWRGRILRLAAVIAMAKQPNSEQQNTIGEWLDEALSIFEEQRDPYQIGQVLRAKAVLACWRGEVDEAGEMMTLGAKMESGFAKTLTVAEAAHPGAQSWSHA